MSGLITDYLTQGLAASRPAAPSAASGTLSFYFASDTETLSFYDWNDAAWQDVGAGAYLALTGGTLSGALNVPDAAYDATGWNGSNEVPTKNAVRDKIEAVVAMVPSAYTDEMAQDAIGAMVDGSLTYVDATPLLQRAALTGDVTATAGSNATTIANNAVTTVKINNDAVTFAKIVNASANSVLIGAGASGSGADYTEITLGTNLTMSGTTLNATGGGGGGNSDVANHSLCGGI